MTSLRLKEENLDSEKYQDIRTWRRCFDGKRKNEKRQNSLSGPYKGGFRTARNFAPGLNLMGRIGGGKKPWQEPRWGFTGPIKKKVGTPLTEEGRGEGPPPTAKAVRPRGWDWEEVLFHIKGGSKNHAVSIGACMSFRFREMWARGGGKGGKKYWRSSFFELEKMTAHGGKENNQEKERTSN